METACTSKALLVKVAYACMVFVWLEGCQGCNSRAVGPSIESPEKVIPYLGGIPNLTNTCYMNAVLQIIAKLYPDIFDDKDCSLAQAGRIIVGKIKDDRDCVTSGEADEFYTALLGLDAAKEGQWTRDKQESADECMDILWDYLGLPKIDHNLGSMYVTLGLRYYSDENKNKKETMQHLLDNYASSATISSIKGFLNDIIPIKLNRLDTNKGASIKINTAVKEALQLTITEKHISGLPEELHCHLVGFIVHDGTATGGHYVAYIRRGGQWRLYNDDCVQATLPEEVEQAAEKAYLYFYSKTSAYISTARFLNTLKICRKNAFY